MRGVFLFAAALALAGCAQALKKVRGYASSVRWKWALTVLAAAASAAPNLSNAADTIYYCAPDEPRVTAPDRLVSVTVRLKPDGSFVSIVYMTANGTQIDRSSQYDGANGKDGNFRYWIGKLRNNPNVGMMGSFRRVDGKLIYYETVHDNKQRGKVVAQVISLCDAGRLDYAEAAPPAPQYASPQPEPARPVPKPKLPDAEMNKFIDCVRAATVVLASTSDEPAQTIVDAAAGECGKERMAFVNALERQGIEKSFDLVDGLSKDMRPNLLALVLNARASAGAKPAEQPTKTEQAKGQPL